MGEERCSFGCGKRPTLARGWEGARGTDLSGAQLEVGDWGISTTVGLNGLGVGFT